MISKHAEEATGKCIGWILPDSDPPTDGDIEACNKFIQSAIDAATAELANDNLDLITSHRTKDNEIAQKDKEIERLKAGGCARDQKTTQFCAEALEKDKRIAELEQMKKDWCFDWAESDTNCKKLAEPFIGDFDGPRPKEERGSGFRDVEDVVEALVHLLGVRKHEVDGLLALSEHFKKRIEAMAKLLDDMPHLDIYSQWIVWRVARPELVAPCAEGCPRCAADKLLTNP